MAMRGLQSTWSSVVVALGLSLVVAMGFMAHGLSYSMAPDHLTCFLRNLYAGLEATVRAGHGTTFCLEGGGWFHNVGGT